MLLERLNQMDIYKNLCAQYYDLDKPTAPEDALKFYLEYAKNANGPIYEPMCGTGGFLIPMAQLGLDIEGSDASLPMLSICEKKCERAGIKPKVSHQFIHEIFDRKYLLIFIPSGSFGLITDVQAAKKVLKNLYDHLQVGGKLVFEVETFQAVPTDLGAEQSSSVSNVDEGTKIQLTTLPTYDKNTQILKILCRYDLLKDEEVLDSEVEDFRVRHYDSREMDDWLKDVGFNQILRFGGYEKTPLTAKDEIIVYECIK